MRNSKLGLRALGVSVLAVLGMMAFAVTAQAQDLASAATNSAGLFLINLGAALLATFTGSQHLTPEGLLLVAGRNLIVKCHSAHLEGGKLNGLTEGLVKVVYLGCLPFVMKTLEPIANCKIPNKEILAVAKVLAFLHNGLNYVLFEPHEANPGTENLNFTVVTFEAGKGCALPLSNPVKGTVNAQVDEHSAVNQKILFSEAIQKLTAGTLSFGGFPSFVTATALVELTGEHVGDAWGVH